MYNSAFLKWWQQSPHRRKSKDHKILKNIVIMRTYCKDNENSGVECLKLKSETENMEQKFYRTIATP